MPQTAKTNGRHGRKKGQQQPTPEIIGLRFGDLEVLEYFGIRQGRRWWRCRCLSETRTGSPCGNERIVQTGALNRIGGRRCKECNQHLLQQRANDASKWIYKYGAKA